MATATLGHMFSVNKVFNNQSAWYFDGNDYISSADDNLLTCKDSLGQDTDLTIAVRFTPDIFNDLDNSEQVIVSKYNENSDSGSFKIYLQRASVSPPKYRIWGKIWGYNNSITYVNDLYIENDAPFAGPITVIITFKYDGVNTITSWYVNDHSDTHASAWQRVWTSYNPVKIGGFASGDPYQPGSFRGKVHWFAGWHRALESSEINQILDGEYPRDFGTEVYVDFSEDVPESSISSEGGAHLFNISGDPELVYTNRTGFEFNVSQVNTVQQTGHIFKVSTSSFQEASWWTFDTTDDALELSADNDDFDPDTSFSVAVLVEPNDSTPKARTLAAKWGSTDESKSWRLYTDSNGKICASVFVTTDSLGLQESTVTTDTVLPDGKSIVYLAYQQFGDGARGIRDPDDITINRVFDTTALSVGVYNLTDGNTDAITKTPDTWEAAVQNTTTPVTIGKIYGSSTGSDCKLYWIMYCNDVILNSNDMLQLYGGGQHPMEFYPDLYIDFSKTVGSTYTPEVGSYTFNVQGNPVAGGSGTSSYNSNLPDNAENSWWRFYSGQVLKSSLTGGSASLIPYAGIKSNVTSFTILCLIEVDAERLDTDGFLTDDFRSEPIDTTQLGYIVSAPNSWYLLYNQTDEIIIGKIGLKEDPWWDAPGLSLSGALQSGKTLIALTYNKEDNYKFTLYRIDKNGTTYQQNVGTQLQADQDDGILSVGGNCAIDNYIYHPFKGRIYAFGMFEGCVSQSLLEDLYDNTERLNFVSQTPGIKPKYYMDFHKAASNSYVPEILEPGVGLAQNTLDFIEIQTNFGAPTVVSSGQDTQMGIVGYLGYEFAVELETSARTGHKFSARPVSVISHEFAVELEVVKEQGHEFFVHFLTDTQVGHEFAVALDLVSTQGSQFNIPDIDWNSSQGHKFGARPVGLVGHQFTTLYGGIAGSPSRSYQSGDWSQNSTWGINAYTENFATVHTNQYIEYLNNNFDFGDEFTIVVLCQPDAVDYSSHYLVSKRDGSNINGKEVEFYQAGANLYGVVYNTGGLSTALILYDVMVANEYNLLACTYKYVADNTSELGVYGNGSETNVTNARGPIPNTAAKFMVGSYNYSAGSPTHQFNGRFYYMAVYDKILTKAELDNLRSFQITPNSLSPVLFVNFTNYAEEGQNIDPEVGGNQFGLRNGAELGYQVVPQSGIRAVVNNPHVVEIDQDITVGDSPRDSFTYVLTINDGGTLKWKDNPTGDWTVTIKGNVYIAAGPNGQGSFLIGTEANPIPETRIATVEFPYQLGNAHWEIYNRGGIFKTYGAEAYHMASANSQTTTLNSSVTAGSDIIFTTSQSVNWEVGDEIWVASGSDYTISSLLSNNYEKIIIKTKTNAYTYTADFIYSHVSGDHLSHVTRNVIFKSSSESYPIAIRSESYNIGGQWIPTHHASWTSFQDAGYIYGAAGYRIYSLTNESGMEISSDNLLIDSICVDTTQASTYGLRLDSEIHLTDDVVINNIHTWNVSHAAFFDIQGRVSASGIYAFSIYSSELIDINQGTVSLSKIRLYGNTGVNTIGISGVPECVDDFQICNCYKGIDLYGSNDTAGVDPNITISNGELYFSGLYGIITQGTYNMNITIDSVDLCASKTIGMRIAKGTIFFKDCRFDANNHSEGRTTHLSNGPVDVTKYNHLYFYNCDFGMRHRNWERNIYIQTSILSWNVGRCIVDQCRFKQPYSDDVGGPFSNETGQLQLYYTNTMFWAIDAGFYGDWRLRCNVSLNATVEFVDCEVYDSSGTNVWDAKYPSRVAIVNGGGQVQPSSDNQIDGSYPLTVRPFSVIQPCYPNIAVPIKFPVSNGDNISVKISIRRTGSGSYGHKPGIVLTAPGVYETAFMSGLGWEDVIVSGTANNSGFAYVYFSAGTNRREDLSNAEYKAGWNSAIYAQDDVYSCPPKRMTNPDHGSYKTNQEWDDLLNGSGHLNIFNVTVYFDGLEVTIT